MLITVLIVSEDDLHQKLVERIYLTVFLMAFDTIWQNWALKTLLCNSFGPSRQKVPQGDYGLTS